MVLTDHEKTVLTELLSGVNAYDLIQIAKTVSQKLIDINSPARAVEVILLHSQTVESVLHRKKISKQLLFNYLHYQKVPVQPHLSKDELIQRLVNFWKTISNNFQNDTLESNISSQSSSSWSSELPSTSQDSLPSSALYNTQTYYNESQDMTNLSNINQYANENQSLQSYQIHGNYQTESIVPQTQCLNNQIDINSQIDIINSIDDKQLGLEFTKWFYEKLNGCNHTSSYFLDSSMFFENATGEFKIIQSVNNELDEKLFKTENNKQIANYFSHIQQTYNVYFNPNMSSLKTNKNNYGNIILGVCGSLHNNSLLVGIFEQLIQLFNDPLCVNDKPVWKIQKILFNLKFVESNNHAIESSNSQLE